MKESNLLLKKIPELQDDIYHLAGKAWDLLEASASSTPAGIERMKYQRAIGNTFGNLLVPDE